MSNVAYPFVKCKVLFGIEVSSTDDLSYHEHLVESYTLGRYLSFCGVCFTLTVNVLT